VVRHVPSGHRVAHAPHHLATIRVCEHSRCACNVALKPRDDLFADAVADIDWTDSVNLHKQSLECCGAHKTIMYIQPTMSTCVMPGCSRYVIPAHDANCSRTSCTPSGGPVAIRNIKTTRLKSEEEEESRANLLLQEWEHPQIPQESCCGARTRRRRS
jgi:hypothetical protein